MYIIHMCMCVSFGIAHYSWEDAVINIQQCGILTNMGGGHETQLWTSDYLGVTGILCGWEVLTIGQ